MSIHDRHISESNGQIAIKFCYAHSCSQEEEAIDLETHRTFPLDPPSGQTYPKK
uniref:Uncharacterized protein n=1 Tax=Anguilla anguilla TaxID=7936 RepID=A0A0E9UVL3_ANGAN